MSQQASTRIRILIVDDHPVVRAGLASMLSTVPAFAVVGSAATGEEAMKMLRTAIVDIVMLDLRMPGMNGMDILRAMKHENFNARSIVLTNYETDEDIYRAIEAGAYGYLLKNTLADDMVQAVRLVHAGGRYIPGRISRRLTERTMRADLTPREREILELLVKGLTNKEIGQVLGISGNTARNHVKSIIEKLDVTDRTEAATTAIQRGLIDVAD